MIKCDICESALQMDEDRSGATCTGCGMKYSIEQVRQMVGGQAQAAPVKAETKKPEVAKPVPEKTEPEIVEPSWKEVKVVESQGDDNEPVVVTDWVEAESGDEPAQYGGDSTAVTSTKKKANLTPYILGLIGVLFTTMGGFFPMLIGDIIVIIAIVMFIQNVRKRK